LSAARVNVLQVLGSQGANAVAARPSSMRRWLVGAQIAGSTAFLAIAALFVQSLDRVVDLDLGFEPQQIVMMELEPAASGLDAAAAERYTEAVVTRIRALPGVADAAVIDRAPFFIGYDRTTAVWPNGSTCDGATCPKVSTLFAGPGYFRTMGIGVAAGREFTGSANGAGVIVNQAFAKQQWPDGRGLGETIRVGDQGEALTVVGVTAPHRTRGLDAERPTLYLPLSQETYEGAVTVVARAADPLGSVRPITEAVQAVDSRMAVVTAKTMAERMSVQTWPFRTLGRVFAICGLLALLLATAGLAASVIHAVSRRQREFGVRLSIGATPRDLAGDVLRQGLSLLVPGFAIGALVAAGIARLAQAIFLGVNVLNPITYLIVGAIECAVVIVACLGPALRASRIDPLIALRSE
jgi:predicted permease